MMERFANKVVLLTGAASGIGRATAERLALEGATLALVDINADGLDQTVQTCRDSGAEVLSLVGDISSESSVAEIIESTVNEFGRIDVLCNIAGILQFKDFRLTTLDDWNKIIGVNLTGTFLMCRDALPHLLESQGNIVNMSSTASLGGHPWTAPYSASKGGIQAMSLGIAVEFGKIFNKHRRTAVSQSHFLHVGFARPILGIPAEVRPQCTAVIGFSVASRSDDQDRARLAVLDVLDHRRKERSG